MIRRPPRSTQSRSSAASDVYKRQVYNEPPTKGTLMLIDSLIGESLRKRLGRTTKAGTLRSADISPMSSLFAVCDCLLYTSDAADDLLCVVLGGRRLIKKKK